jgi:HK97 gp10 family phage protein
MAQKAAVTFELLGTLDAFKLRASKAIHDAVTAEVRDVGELALSAVREAAPVGNTGNLRNSLELDISSGGHFASIRANYKKKGNHAHLLEFGTVRMAPHPFLYPTVDRIRPLLSERLKARLG